MELRNLGTTGLKVSPLCLGAMMFGDYGNTDRSECAKIVERCLDFGINFIDTADIYSQGQSEEILGEIFRNNPGMRESIVLATKVNMQMGTNPLHAGNSRRWIIEEVENSLRRLQTDYIDLYQIHRPDPETDIDETLGALTDLVHAGKVRYIGSSTFPASHIVEAQWTAERRGRERFACEQPPYSLLVRRNEVDVFPTLQRYGMGAITWSPLAGGWLSGKYRKNQEIERSRRFDRLPGRYDMRLNENQHKLEFADQFAVLADEVGMSLIEMSIAFVIRHPAVTSAIIGPRTIEHLESQLTPLDVTLTEEILDRIDAIVPPGVTVNMADDGYIPPSITDASQRRR